MSYKESGKVVCVDDNFAAVIHNPAYRFVGPMPVKDQVYTIEKVMVDDEGTYAFRLTGSTAFINLTHRGESEVGFRAIRFRKLDEVKQSAPRVDAIGTEA